MICDCVPRASLYMLLFTSKGKRCLILLILPYTSLQCKLVPVYYWKCKSELNCAINGRGMHKDQLLPSVELVCVYINPASSYSAMSAYDSYQYPSILCTWRISLLTSVCKLFLEGLCNDWGGVTSIVGNGGLPQGCATWWSREMWLNSDVRLDSSFF